MDDDAEDLTGRLLVAVPGPRPDDEDPEPDVFDHGVVLVLHHDQESGAHGLVLNHPLQASVEAILPGWERHVSPPDMVFQGGPVQVDSALGLVSLPPGVETLGLKRLFADIALVDLDAPTALVAAEIGGMRVFAGYAGWEQGQLEHEIAAGIWWVVDCRSRDPFTPHPELLWSSVLRRQRNELSFAVHYPNDPSRN